MFNVAFSCCWEDQRSPVAPSHSSLINASGESNAEANRATISTTINVSDRAFDQDQETSAELIIFSPQSEKSNRKRVSSYESIEISNDPLERFVHNVQTPLNYIEKLLKNINKNGLTNEDRENIDISLEATAIMQDLVNNRLDFINLETNGLKLVNESFMLHELIHQTIKIFSHKSQEKSLHLETLIEDSVPQMVSGDKIRLRQILLNLIGNAFKFTEKGFIKVAAKPESNGNGGSFVLRFEITDSGRGMTPEELSKLFQPYVQANFSIAKQHGGSGLGLWISKSLCELMGGTIGAESTLGVSSTFWFTAKFTRPTVFNTRSSLIRNSLQSGVSEEEAQTVRHAPDSIAQFAHELRNPIGAIIYALRSIKENQKLSESIAFYVDSMLTETNNILNLLNETLDYDKKKYLNAEALEEPVDKQIFVKPLGIRVLVAEDSELVQKMTKKILSSRGFTDITFVNNGQEAAKHAHDSFYDIILMDVQMPIMNGPDASKIIRNYSGKKGKTPIIALSGDQSEDIAKTCYGAGMNAYLLKPVDSLALTRAINKQLVAKISGAYAPSDET